MKKIFIIENAELMSIKLVDILKQNGFGNVEIINPYMLKSKNIHTQIKDSELIIIDFDNCNIDAFEMIKNLKNEKDILEVPIIVLSSSSDLATLKKVLAAGIKNFIIKPFSAKTFMNKVVQISSMQIQPLLLKEENQSDEIIYEESPVLKWTKDFEIEVDFIDDEHKQIIKHFEYLYSLMKEGRGHEYYKELLIFLKDYIQRHFEHEEQYQKDIGYDLIAEHKVLHDNFRQRLFNIIEMSEDKPVSNKDLIKINIFMKDWLIHHILVEDRKIKNFNMKQ